MEKLVIVTRAGCPYCESLEESIKNVLARRPEYAAAQISIIDEESREALELDHFYAPAFFAGTQRISEGDGGEEAVEKALEFITKASHDKTR